jgi:2-oxoglutarate dehydrogenase E2 component (dihydrolipoamide succinyltransferase)
MGQYHLKLPKMGESVTEATVTKWLLEVGDTIQLDDSIVEIATDKVDTDVTSEVEGILTEKCFQENEIVKVGETLVIIEIKGEVVSQSEMNIDLDEDFEPEKNKVPEEIEVSTPKKIANELELEMEQASSLKTINVQEGNRFYSPLVRSIAKKEGISLEELEGINGTGKDQRLTKKDILVYISQRVGNVIKTDPLVKSDKFSFVSSS